MNWTPTPARLAASALALACIATGALLATGAHAATGAGSHAQTTLADGANPYTVKTAPSGGGMSVSITVNGDWHINKAYPVKFNAKPVDASKISYAGPGDNPLGITLTIPDAKAGNVKFGYCKADGSSCAFGAVDVKL